MTMGSEEHLSLEAELVFIDVETTGLQCASEYICEIAALRHPYGGVIEHFSSLVRPPKPIPEEVFRIHRISDAMVQSAPVFEEVADTFLSFIKGKILCGYNVGFDIGFINRELARLGKAPLPHACIDVLRMARDLLPGLPRYSLGAVGGYLGFETDDLHRAYSDVCLEVRVFDRLSAAAVEKNVSIRQRYLCPALETLPLSEGNGK